MRIHNYCRGIISAGGGAQILILRPTERSAETAQNTKQCGRHEGVEYEYTCGATIRSRSFIKRRWLEIKGIARATIAVVKDRERTDAVLLVTNFWPYIVYFALLCRSLGILCLQEKSEFPFHNRTPRNLIERVYQAAYKRHVYRCFDGLLVISHPLQEFFAGKIRRTAQLLLVPPIVDPKEFSMRRDDTDELTIVYCGTLTQKKDGILTLIRAFREVCNKYDNLRLYVVGRGSGNNDEEESRQLARDFRIEDRIIFAGYVPRERLRRLVCDASVLALAKPTGLQSDYCFPSKIAEYLATGNPVVVTDTGEISRYLKDGLNAFVTKPDDTAAFAEKLEFILSNPGLAREVGQKGREIALDAFDYRIQARRIMSFIMALQAGRSPRAGRTRCVQLDNRANPRS
jgi:glycosyltransferase involved in cell wall biosynthesis